MKFESIGLVVSEEIMFWCVDGTPIWATLAEKLKWTMTFETYL